MRISLAQLRGIIREVLADVPMDVCRVCSGEGQVVGEFCATCGGTGQEIDPGVTKGRPGIGRGPLPWRK